ncbi:MAG: hypothetical protein ABFD89_17855 [Bryobacteraceae bacterium]
MKTPTQTLHELAGIPTVEGATEASGYCYFCAGKVSRGIPIDSWLKSSFTDQNRARCPSATHICEACAHITLWTAPPGRPPGNCPSCSGTGKITKIQKKGKSKNATVGDDCESCKGSGVSSKGYNWRLFSHLYEENWQQPGQQAPGYANCTKGDKPLIRAFLEREHAGNWFAAVSDSGQKHVLPLTRWNFGNSSAAGVIMFDETEAAIPDDVSIIATACDLLTAGATKDELLTGDYRIATIERCGESVREFERTHKQWRGGPWFELVVWLAQRDEEQVEARHESEKSAKKEAAENAKQRTSRPARDKSHKPDPGSQKRVHARSKGQASAGLLDQNRKQNAGGGAPSEVSEPLVHPVPAGHAADKRGQFGLFGSD